MKDHLLKAQQHQYDTGQGGDSFSRASYVIWRKETRVQIEICALTVQ